MRSMNMLQLLGGVAVAGAVAAGTTAFTAGSGLGTSVSSKVIGGRTSVTVSGANIAGLTFAVDSANSHEDHVTGVTLHLQNDTPADIDTGVTVTAAFTGTAVGGAPASTTAITCVAQGSNGLWDCDAGLSLTKYYTGVTALAVTVV